MTPSGRMVGLKRRVLLVDNADSFTWNLSACMERLGARCTVVSHADFSMSMLATIRPERIVLSPGPGHPRDAHASLRILAAYEQSTSPLTIPLLGVCLGHQCMAWHWGGEGAIGHAPVPLHGETSVICHTHESIFVDMPRRIHVARYHSLVVRQMPQCCRLLAWTDDPDHIVMAMRHTVLPIVGVQFHPESFLTPKGDMLLQRFLITGA